MPVQFSVTINSTETNTQAPWRCTKDLSCTHILFFFYPWRGSERISSPLFLPSLSKIQHPNDAHAHGMTGPLQQWQEGGGIALTHEPLQRLRQRLYRPLGMTRVGKGKSHLTCELCNNSYWDEHRHSRAGLRCLDLQSATHAIG